MARRPTDYRLNDYRLSQIRDQLLHRLLRQLLPSLVAAVRDAEGSGGAGDQGGSPLRADREADVVDRRDAILAALPRTEQGRMELRAELQDQMAGLVQADEFVEHGLDPSRLGDFDEERGGQLAGPGEQRVVRVDLVLDLLGLDDPLYAEHLLDLEPHGVAVLEHQRHQRPQRDPAPLLGFDDAAAKLGPRELVLVEVLKVGGGQGLHDSHARPRFV